MKKTAIAALLFVAALTSSPAMADISIQSRADFCFIATYSNGQQVVPPRTNTNFFRPGNNVTVTLRRYNTGTCSGSLSTFGTINSGKIAEKNIYWISNDNIQKIQ